MAEATWALVSVTFLLVAVATWYAWETRRMVARMEEDLRTRLRPLLTFQVIPWGGVRIKLRIQNLGPGPALNIKGEVHATYDSGDEAFSWSYPLLAPGKYEEFGFPAPHGATREDRFRLDRIRRRVQRLNAHFTYSSASGDELELKESPSIGEITQDWVTSRMMATEDHPERLGPRIARALDEIERHLRLQEGGFG